LVVLTLLYYWFTFIRVLFLEIQYINRSLYVNFTYFTAFSDCKTPASPQNGLVSANGTLAAYTCLVGHSLEGARTRTCADDGSGWSGTNPVCSKLFLVLTI